MAGLSDAQVSRRGGIDLNYILSIDQGTTGTTSMILTVGNGPAQVISHATCDFPQHFPQPDWVEHRLDQIWDSVCTSIRQACKLASEQDDAFAPDKLVAIGITNQRETLCAFDRKSGEALAPASVWQCKRSAKICEQLKAQGVEPLLRNKTGLLCDPYFSATKLAWWMEHCPDVVRAFRDAKGNAGTVATFLVHRLTAGIAHVTESSNASRTLLYNIHTLDWDTELLESFG